MLTYHMGWTGEGAGAQATGKRIRPLITLLSVASIKNEYNNQANWLHAKSLAAAIELVHNFSLVHDDIQDNSELRRGRKTAWVKWGAPMAINAGDALFVIANQAALDLRKHYPAEIVVRAASILNDCKAFQQDHADEGVAGKVPAEDREGDERAEAGERQRGLFVHEAPHGLREIDGVVTVERVFEG